MANSEWVTIDLHETRGAGVSRGNRTDELAVPGGKLYRVTTWSTNSGYRETGEAVSVALTFVPDPPKRRRS